MKLRIEGTPEEFAARSEDLTKAFIDHLREHDATLADSLEKALPRKEQSLKYPAIQTIHKKVRDEYAKTLDRIVRDVGKVLERPSALAKSMDFHDHTEDIVAKEEIAYEKVKAVLSNLVGATQSDFEEGGKFYGMSTNELIEYSKSGVRFEAGK